MGSVGSISRKTATLYLLSGLPCSGKTTHARQLEAQGAHRVSVDELMIGTHGRLGVDYDSGTHLDRLGPVLADAQELVTAHLANESDVVLDHGLGLRVERDAWKQLASRAGAQWELIRFDADMATLRARCALRSLSPLAVPITDALLHTLAGTWEPPTGEGERCFDSTADWVRDFYSITGRWWGAAEDKVDPVDQERARWLAELIDEPSGRSVLELGCGYGTTAAATADLGFVVTGIDFSDRVDRAPAGKASFVRADFLTHDFGQRFAVVTYWDGFGVSDDEGQLALLNRIAADLVEPNGVVVIEVFDPTGCQADDGLVEHKPASPERGYPCSLDHARTFDATSQRAIDAWKETDGDHIWSQSLRCYSPEAFADLVSASNLRLRTVLHVGRSDWSYIAVLQPR